MKSEIDLAPTPPVHCTGGAGMHESSDRREETNEDSND